LRIAASEVRHETVLVGPVVACRPPPGTGRLACGDRHESDLNGHLATRGNGEPHPLRLEGGWGARGGAQTVSALVGGGGLPGTRPRQTHDRALPAKRRSRRAAAPPGSTRVRGAGLLQRLRRDEALCVGMHYRRSSGAFAPFFRSITAGSRRPAAPCHARADGWMRDVRRTSAHLSSISARCALALEEGRSSVSRADWRGGSGWRRWLSVAGTSRRCGR
jgi:hypothetical protein